MNKTGQGNLEYFTNWMLYTFIAICLLIASSARGTDVNGGGDANAALSAGGTVRLQRGGTFRGPLKIVRSATTLTTFGDPAAAAPRITGGGLRCDGKTDVAVDGLWFDGTGVRDAGARFFNVARVKFTRNTVTNYGGMGLTCEAYGTGKRCSDVAIGPGNVIADNWPSGSGHCSGVFVSFTDGLVFVGNVVDRNGGAPGTETVFNHDVYLHEDCGLAGPPPVVTDNVFANASSHGLQQRSGGVCKGNLFIDNPVGMSYGLVNGAGCYPGGVSGEVSGNVYIGGGDIAGSKRGWAIELSNAKDVKVFDTLIAHDNQNFAKAIQVQLCQRLTNPGAVLSPDRWKLSIRASVWDWPPGDISIASQAQGVVDYKIARPPVQANLRAALGSDFLSRARKTPSTAAQTGIAACRAAAGLGLPVPPPVTQPIPPPVPETLEAVIRNRPADLVPVVESGVAKLKAVTPDVSDPRWRVVGNTVTPE